MIAQVAARDIWDNLKILVAVSFKNATTTHAITFTNSNTKAGRKISKQFFLSACPVALGMESGVILDSQISASSEYSANHAAHQARLHFKESGAIKGSWSSLNNNDYQWLQVDLQQTTRVTRIGTQGRNSNEFNQWVTTYKLQFGEDGHTFTFYRRSGDHKV